jgi:uncharacterized protein YndB with AHSA1/START domain
MSTTDKIEKSIVLKAPVPRVWRALTNHEEFGTWFRVALEGPFVLGHDVRGNVTYAGYEHLRFIAHVVAMEHERVFAFTWTPFPMDPARDYSQETPTRVTFTLAPVPEGTHLTVVESGFDSLPADRRAEAFRMNENGWKVQLENIDAHVKAHV